MKSILNLHIFCGVVVLWPFSDLRYRQFLVMTLEIGSSGSFTFIFSVMMHCLFSCHTHPLHGHSTCSYIQKLSPIPFNRRTVAHHMQCMYTSVTICPGSVASDTAGIVVTSRTQAVHRTADHVGLCVRLCVHREKGRGSCMRGAGGGSGAERCHPSRPRG